MKTLETREDISILVNAFYAKIRMDDLLGPIFNSHITENQWPAHLSKLTDFWDTVLFGAANFKGNPSVKHVKVDENMNYTVEQVHFGKWMQLWFETIDELYEGEMATKAKQNARKMSTGQYLTIWQNRPESVKNAFVE